MIFVILSVSFVLSFILAGRGVCARRSGALHPDSASFCETLNVNHRQPVHQIPALPLSLFAVLDRNAEI